MGEEVAHVVTGGRKLRAAGMLSRACSHHRLSSLHLPDLAKDEHAVEACVGSPDKGHQLAGSNPPRCPSLPISVSPTSVRPSDKLLFDRLPRLSSARWARRILGPRANCLLSSAPWA